ncbi:N-alpha-acetyltransferase 35, NatC auxiliary subunit [Nymphon striatum]|nr:N-alpha-acetyltransferase 35, NatC auxiliary subunit [Nymphon striatum]
MPELFQNEQINRTEEEDLGMNDHEEIKNVNKDDQPVYNWLDITESFNEATCELKLDELSREKSFGLFEAMSAIEMMDPKMDAGMMCNRGNKRVLNFNQAVSEGRIKLKDFTIAEQVGIIDATFACMVTWLEGHSLAQTLFTNLYLHQPFMLEDKVMKSFMIIILKMINIICDFVEKAGVFEEEDFQPMLFGYKLTNEVTKVQAVAMIKEMEDDIQRKVKNTRQKQGEERDEITEAMVYIPLLFINVLIPRIHEEVTALFSRLRFCRLFYQSLLSFSKKECTGTEEAQKHLHICKESLSVISRTINIGIFPEETTENLNKADYPTIMGFEPLVNQRLLSPTFPRYIKICDRTESYLYFGGLVDRLLSACEITECTNFHAALDFCIEYSKASPCVLSRSVLQLLYLPNSNKLMGLHLANDVLRSSIRMFICPPALAPKSPLLGMVHCKEFIDDFLNHCVRPLCGVIKLCGHNRARQRDKLAHILEELVALQSRADKVDTYLYNISSKLEPPRPHLACFGIWILYHTVRVMISFLLSGFELELYSRHEYEYIFWYLKEFLFNWIISALSQADQVLVGQESIVEKQLPKSKNSKKNKKKKKYRSHAREMSFYQAQQSLCSGYYKAVVAFSLEGKMKQPDFQFDNEQVRYEHRFQPFSCILAPPLMHYHKFKDSKTTQRCNYSVEELYLSASKFFEQAKSLFDGISNPSHEILALSKIAKTNLVVMNLVLGGHKKDSIETPKFDFSLHPNFPVIKVL